ncbi:hypothetical protein UFOVP407_54 [uncultured Caudovirales phage]|uniref:Uncharacterized protein n=1 Tax=uncultured Caudovirales phage TaxID=2100421 RepID=A0A6J5M2D6_9CAUD|nr:hypothetical protein UFOVP407_54 [uncultured Caudovirales phage]
MSEYPKMLFRTSPDGDVFFDDERLIAWATHVVADAAEEKAAAADGWATLDIALASLSASDPLDHDGDGKKGGSRRRKAATEE